MSKTIAQAAADYRARRTAKMERMEGSLNAILAKLDGNDKALANELRAIAHEGLGHIGGGRDTQGVRDDG